MRLVNIIRNQYRQSMKNKNFCPTHHLYYERNECPLCLYERLNHYVHKYNAENKVNKQTMTDSNTAREINEEDIIKLTNKYNKRR